MTESTIELQLKPSTNSQELELAKQLIESLKEEASNWVE
jgi:hypothetical protein